MRFPVRLALDLALASVRRGLPGRSAWPAIFPLSILTASSTAALTPVPVDRCLDAVALSRSRIVWIAGPEPLLHPDAPHIARSLTQSGHRVFLPAGGDLLRRRIHEFRPSSDFFFALQFQPSDCASGGHPGSPDRFAAALEGLRVAKLSGFLVCARIFMRPGASLAVMDVLRAALDKLDIDGLFLSPTSPASPVLGCDSQSLARIAPHRRWNRLGRLVDAALAEQPRDFAVSTSAKILPLPPPSRETPEESVPLS